MTALQYRMLELVLEIDAICKKHDIVYYLAGGSVLGAVRHKGFIPWDDDIDIMMTRDAFNKFQEVCATEMADNREIITMMNTPCHTKVTIKYMNKSTCQFFRSQVLDTTGCGISLDIMILDPLPRDEAEKEQHIAEYVVYNELLTPFFMVNAQLYKYIPLYYHYQEEAKKIGKEQVMHHLYTRLFEDEPAESDLYLYRWGQQLLIYDRKLFGTPRYMDFEGYSLPVPEKTVDFLRATYGDTWSYLPAEQNRETHVSNVNTNVAYCNWLKDIQPYLDREKVMSDFVNRKIANVEKAIPAHDVLINNCKQSALLMQMDFETSHFYAYDALAALDDAALLSRTCRYVDLQATGDMVKNNICISIPDATLALILGAMIRTGDFVRADKILKVRKTTVSPLTAELLALEEEIGILRRFIRYFEDRFVDENDVSDIRLLAPELQNACARYPRQINLHRCNLQLCLLMDYSDDVLHSAIDTAMGDYPNDPEIAFWSGCLYEKLGLIQQAQQHYAKSTSTNNGIILQKLSHVNMGGPKENE